MTASSSPCDAVVVVGGGFGGLTAALSLRSRDPSLAIVLVEPRERFLFQPMLYELLSDELQLWEVAPPYKELLSGRGISWLKDSVQSIDGDSRTLTTAGGHTLSWSQLLIATGAEAADFGIPGVRQHAIGFRDLADVGTLRRWIRDLRHQRLDNASLVIAGAGPTGVELACKMADLLEGSARLHLIELSDSILPGNAAFNRERAAAALERRDVTLHPNTAVTQVHADRVDLNNGTSLSHVGLIWTAGSQPNCPRLHPSPALEAGRLPIHPDLSMKGATNIFAIGDATRNADDPWPSTAQVAMQQGAAVAAAIPAVRHNSAAAPFHFEDRGEMLSLGIGDATLTGMGITLAGPLAFQIRRAAYLTRFPGLALGLRSAGAWLLGR